MKTTIKNKREQRQKGKFSPIQTGIGHRAGTAVHYCAGAAAEEGGGFGGGGAEETRLPVPEGVQVTGAVELS